MPGFLLALLLSANAVSADDHTGVPLTGGFGSFAWEGNELAMAFSRLRSEENLLSACGSEASLYIAYIEQLRTEYDAFLVESLEADEFQELMEVIRSMPVGIQRDCEMSGAPCRLRSTVELLDGLYSAESEGAWTVQPYADFSSVPLPASSDCWPNIPSVTF